MKLIKVILLSLIMLINKGYCFDAQQSMNSVNQWLSESLTQEKDIDKQIKSIRTKYAIIKYGVSLSLIALGIWDISDWNIPSVICGLPFVVGGTFIILYF